MPLNPPECSTSMRRFAQRPPASGRCCCARATCWRRMHCTGLRKPRSAHPLAMVLYADEDELDAGRRAPQSEIQAGLVRASRPQHALLRRGCGAARGCPGARRRLLPQDGRNGCYDAVLRVLDAVPDEGDPVVRHIRRSCCTAPAPSHGRGRLGHGGGPRAPRAPRPGSARSNPCGAGCWRVRHALPPQPPLVSMIVPTRDALATHPACIESLRDTRYPRYEVLLVDNQSTRSRCAGLDARAGPTRGAVRLLRYDAPFNYAPSTTWPCSRRRGAGLPSEQRHGSHQPGLAGGDGVVIALQAGVDVVGAKLLYPNGLVQHAGDLVGVGGIANHAHACLRVR